jgi:ribonuclease BN (tRNA processing enzyme)
LTDKGETVSFAKSCALLLVVASTPPDAIGRLAQEAGMRGVLLSHLSPATDAMREAVLTSIRRHYDGPVRFADDGMRVQP